MCEGRRYDDRIFLTSPLESRSSFFPFLSFCVVWEISIYLVMLYAVVFLQE